MQMIYEPNCILRLVGIFGNINIDFQLFKKKKRGVNMALIHVPHRFINPTM